MFSLLKGALTRRNTVYLKSRMLTSAVLIVLAAFAAVVNVIFVFKARNTGIGLSGSLITVLLWISVTGAIAARETFFPYKRLLREQSDELYLADRADKETERYVGDVMQTPYSVLKKIASVFTIAVFAYFAATAIACGVAFGLDEGAYRVVLTIFSALGLAAEAGGAMVYALAIRRFLKERKARRESLKKADLAEEATLPKKVRTRDVPILLQFSDGRDRARYQAGRIGMIVCAVLSLCVFLIPLPVLLGERNIAGIWAIAGVALAVACSAAIAHGAEYRAIRRNMDAQQDDVEGNYRRILGRLTIEYYRRWGWRCAGVFFATAVLAATLGVLEKLELLAPVGDMPGYFVMLGLPLTAVVLIGFGVDTLSGFRAFKADYARFSDLLRPGLLATDVQLSMPQEEDVSAIEATEYEENRDGVSFASDEERTDEEQGKDESGSK